MIIQVPVFIAIDPSSSLVVYHTRKAANFVIRFDTDDDSKPIEFAKKYGTQPLRFHPDTADIFALVFEGAEYRKLIERAKANPIDYCADPIEGERFQEIADAARRTA